MFKLIKFNTIFFINFLNYSFIIINFYLLKIIYFINKGLCESNTLKERKLYHKKY